jgi:hypothetical protein
MILDILKIIAAAATLLTGVLALARPQALTGFTGLRPEGGRGLTELRVSVGAVFAGLGLAALAFNAPVAYRTLGVMYLAMVVVRIPAMFLDRSAETSNIMSAVVEGVFGLLLVL